MHQAPPKGVDHSATLFSISCCSSSPARGFWILNVADDVACECLAAIPDTSSSGPSIVHYQTSFTPDTSSRVARTPRSHRSER
ncbi:hypothetical protein C9E82_23570 [Paracoccus siganidrum]|uniref:Uncharacterized protein n=1 Tax=Paracoccus siganidrum TaxID=1276757 RepID=A0A418ZR35_9RHOB|nr:hypothetical protein D3P05_23680 [Paracoccus siganidrum]RMC24244.1 hypothetical protein C9E82_23570 [Paracoccus siganidrum]